MFLNETSSIFLLFLTEKHPCWGIIEWIFSVFKRDAKTDIVNYRPISILCNVAKPFETVIYKDILSDVRQNISPHQNCFFARRSTTTRLACSTQFLVESVDSRGQVGEIYTYWVQQSMWHSRSRYLNWKVKGFWYFCAIDSLDALVFMLQALASTLL